MKNENKWTSCGLNTDWCVQAWHYGTNIPNCEDGDYYVLDNEDGEFIVARYFPSKEEGCTNYMRVRFSSKADAMEYVSFLVDGIKINHSH